MGKNLSMFFTTDADGVSRPAVGAWSLGAYEYVRPIGAAPERPANLHVQ